MSTKELGDTAEQERFVFTECSDIDDETFGRFYRDVLEPAFPPAELSSLDVLRSAYRTPLPGYHGTVALRAGRPVGGALGEFSAASGVMLLSYLAVKSDQRGAGVGGRLLAEVLPQWREALRPAVILAEIEDPRRHPAGPHGDPVARVRFYQRSGARVLPLSYFQPSLAPGLPRVPGMLLISFDLEPAGVAQEALLAFLDEYQETCEGRETVRTDPDYLALRGQVTAWAGDVPLLPLSRFEEVDPCC